MTFLLLTATLLCVSIDAKQGIEPDALTSFNGAGGARFGEQRERAHAANRTRNELLANVSHELRTPMNAVVGFASLLEERARSPENATFLDAIQSAGKTLLRLIDDLLDLSRIEAGQLELRIGSTDLRAVSAELMGLYAHQFAEKGLDFQVSVDPRVPRGLALDEVRIRQILFNLIDNAKKFTDQGGIELEISASPSEVSSFPSLRCTLSPRICTGSDVATARLRRRSER